MSTSPAAPPQISSPETLQQFLRMQFPGKIPAMVATHCLTEILSLNLSQIIPISDMNPAMMGVCNWRGEVLWIADLGYFLGFEPLYVQSLRKGQVSTIVVHQEGQTLGLGVEFVDQMLWCDRTQIQPESQQLVPSSALTPYIEGYWPDLTGDALVLDIEAIMDSFK
jgi:positive phototaxis protein PixI